MKRTFSSQFQRHQSEYSADDHNDFHDDLHWCPSAIFFSVSPFVPAPIAQMVYQKADEALVTEAHSNDGTEGVISVEQLLVFITEAPRWAKSYKSTPSIQQSSNCSCSTSLIIFNPFNSNFTSNCQALDKMIDSTFLWKRPSQTCMTCISHAPYSWLWYVNIKKSTFHSHLKHCLTARLSVSSPPLPPSSFSSDHLFEAPAQRVASKLHLWC